MAHYWSASHELNVDLLQYFGDLVNSRAKGQIVIKNYPGGTVANLETQNNAVSRGIADFTVAVNPAQTMSLSLLAEAPYPESPSDYFLVRKAWEAARQFWEPQYNALTLKPIATYASGRYDMYTKKEVRAKEDLKGLKIRGATVATMRIIDALGASPVNISTAEMYTALERGTIDGSLGIFSSMLGMKAYEVSKYLFMADLMRPVFVIVMNLNSWKGLSKDLQDIIMQAGLEAADHLSKLRTERDVTDVKLLQEKGVKVYYPPDAELKRWKDAGKSVVDYYFEKEGAAGKQLYEAVAKAALELQKTK